MKPSSHTLAEDLFYRSEQGRQALRAGTVPFFTGFPLAIKNRVTLAFLPTEEAVQQLRQRILNPLQIEQTASRLVCIYAALNFPFHITLGEGLWAASANEETEPSNRRQAFQRILDQEEEFLAVANRFVGQTIEFNYLVSDDKGSLLLAADHIPEEIEDARDRLDELYNRYGFKHLRIHNLLDSTVAQIMVLPEMYVSDYLATIFNLNRAVGAFPLKFKIEQTVFKPSHRFLTEQSQGS